MSTSAIDRWYEAGRANGALGGKLVGAGAGGFLMFYAEDPPMVRAAMRREGAWTYVFGDLDAARDGAALVEGARLLARSADGLMPWRGRPEPLKRGLIARVPPIEYEDGE